MNNCSICGKKIVLSPSAKERAAKDVTGKTEAYYTSLFTTHSECVLAQRHKPLPVIPIKDMRPMFQNAELLRLRQRACKLFGVDAGSRETARYVNGLDEAALLAML